MGIEPTNQNSRCGSTGFEDQTRRQMGGTSQAGELHHPIKTLRTTTFLQPTLPYGEAWKVPVLTGPGAVATKVLWPPVFTAGEEKVSPFAPIMTLNVLPAGTGKLKAPELSLRS